MTTGETLYTGRTTRPDVLEVGRDNVVTMEIRRDGALVAPSSGTLVLYSPSNASIATPTVAISGSIATATIAAADLPTTLAKGVRYLEVWTLTISGSPAALEFARESTVAARRLVPCVAVIDLLARVPGLDSEFGTTPLVRLQGFLDEGFAHIVNRLQSQGILAEYIVSTEAIREVHVHYSLYLCYRALNRLEMNSGQPSGYDEDWRHHLEQYKESWSEMTFRRDVDGDGFADEDSRQGAGNNVIHRNAPPTRRVGHRRAW